MLTPDQQSAIPLGFSQIPLNEASKRALIELDTWAFPACQDVDDLASWPFPLDLERTRAWSPDGQAAPIAMHTSYAFAQFPVPGATVAAAGLSWVGVHPQYRRRGLLRAMIGTHFDDCARRGEALSVLTASEPGIYGRFGYGLASRVVGVQIPRGAELRQVAGADQVDVRFERFDEAVHGPVVARLHRHIATATPNRPGWVTRDTDALRSSFGYDPQALRGGFEERRIMIAGREDATGYALFRRKLDWSGAGAQGVAKVEELAATDAASRAALWSRLLDLDLIKTVTARLLPIDDPLLQLLVDPRAAEPQVSDNLWVRLVDVPSALVARHYAAPLDLAIRVNDHLLPHNSRCWRLRARPFSDDIHVEPAAQASVELDIADLGALYLGGTSAASLAAAGLITGDAAAIAQLSAAFGWGLQPASSWIF